MAKYGISVPDEIAEKIEAPLEENASRSARIRELVRLGLAAESVMDDKQWHPRAIKDREELVEEAMEMYIYTKKEDG